MSTWEKSLLTMLFALGVWLISATLIGSLDSNHQETLRELDKHHQETARRCIAQNFKPELCRKFGELP